MLTESLRTLLGAELSAQVEAAVKGKGPGGKDIDLVVGNDGSYVPAEKYNGEKTSSQTAATALKAAADALKAIGGSGDPAKIADDVKTAQTTMKTLQTDYDAKVRALTKTTALKLALADAVQDPSDILPLLDMTKIEVDDAGNLKTDLKTLVDPIKTAKPYLFKPEKKPETLPVTGAAPAGTSGKPTDPSSADLEKMSYDEYRAWRAKNP